MTSADAAGKSQHGPAPETYTTDVLVLCYVGIIAAAGGSLTYNIWHASHKGHLQIFLAVIYGFLPPFLATIMAHLAASTRVGWWGRGWVFVVTAAAMYVSAYATSQVVEPVSGLGTSVVFSLMTDAASMTCLFYLLKAYNAKAAYRRWLAETAAEIIPGSGNQEGTGSGNQEGTGSGNQEGTGSGNQEGTGSGNQEGTGSGNQEGTGSGNQEGTGSAGGGLGGSGGQEETGSANSEDSAGGPGRPDRKRTQSGEERAAVVAELAARPGRALESSAHREQRALAVLAEFKRRTGLRMNNSELALVLGMRKADSGQLRRAISSREEGAAA